MKQTYEGSCHSGKVRFRATLDPAECFVCDCSICTKKGSTIIRIEEPDFELATPLDELSVYQFNKNIAKHYFCPTCGVHPFNRPRSYPDKWAVNVRCLQGVDVGTLQPRQVFGSKLD
ncbi:MAG: GFA family protein [Gammaproteobacteria bacterium]|nr:GFA family protein [Gammaproteobacteria bacterium]MDH5320958.1 GFA family protein [Gammaproteobacteria bacterium]